MPKASFPITASPLGEEEPGLKGAERGGYLPIPRRDARAGEWDFWQRFSGAELAVAARATEGSESLSVTLPRCAATSTLRSMVRGAGWNSCRRGVERQSRERHQDMNLKEKQGDVAREAKRNEHGAPSPEYDQLPGRRPRGGGRSPSFKRQIKQSKGIEVQPAPSCTGTGCPISKVVRRTDTVFLWLRYR